VLQESTSGNVLIIALNGFDICTDLSSFPKLTFYLASTVVDLVTLNLDILTSGTGTNYKVGGTGPARK